jgi:hypothetical protein
VITVTLDRKVNRAVKRLYAVQPIDLIDFYVRRPAGEEEVEEEQEEEEEGGGRWSARGAGSLHLHLHLHLEAPEARRRAPRRSKKALPRAHEASS